MFPILTETSSFQFIGTPPKQLACPMSFRPFAAPIDGSITASFGPVPILSPVRNRPSLGGSQDLHIDGKPRALGDRVNRPMPSTGTCLPLVPCRVIPPGRKMHSSKQIDSRSGCSLCGSISWRGPKISAIGTIDWTEADRVPNKRSRSRPHGPWHERPRNSDDRPRPVMVGTSL